MKKETIVKILSKIESDEGFVVPERFVPHLLDMGYIEIKRECIHCTLGIFSVSTYELTQKGKDFMAHLFHPQVQP